MSQDHDGDTGYTVSVDYGKTIEEMVSAGRYDWSNSDVNSENFRVNGTGVDTIALELICLNEAVSSEEVLARLEANGMRPASLAELLAFGVTYPEVQRQFPVVALGSSWVDRRGDRRRAPYLSGYGSERKLFLYRYDNVWSGVCLFLAVRK